MITFLVTLFASIATSTAVVGLDPSEAEVSEPQVMVSQNATDVVSSVSTPDHRIADHECSAYLADFCVEVPIRSGATPQLTSDEVRSCSTGSEHQPSRSLETVAAAADTTSAGAIRVRFEIEAGLAIDGDCFADQVMSVLNDPRGWAGTDGVSFARVDGSAYDLRLVLASPQRTDTLCHPARTIGRFSCRKQDSVILNLMRWESGTDDYSDDLSTYRTYLVNHEVGHFLGRGHLRCPGSGVPAPVMMQQTKGLGECLPNGWPTKDES